MTRFAYGSTALEAIRARICGHHGEQGGFQVGPPRSARYERVVQCGAVWCSVVQHGAAWCSVVQRGAAWCSVVQCGAVWCSVVQCNAVVQRGAVCCSML